MTIADALTPARGISQSPSVFFVPKEGSHMRRQFVARDELDEEHLEGLVRRTLDGDKRAWAELWCALAPMIERIARRFRVTSRLSGREDERRDVVVRVMERLHADQFHRLHSFHAVLLRRDGSFRAWIAVVVTRTAISYTREHPEHVGAEAPDAPRRWVDLVPLPEELDEQLPVSSRVVATIEAHGIEAYAEHYLGPEQREGLRLWLLGHDREEIAGALRLSGAHEADLLVRAGLKRLRDQFAGEGDPRKGNRPGQVTNRRALASYEE